MVALFIRLSIILVGLTGLFLILPDSQGLPVEVQESVVLMLTQARALDWIIPINTLLQVLGYSIAFHAGIFLFKGLTWLMKHVTTGSAGS